MVGRDCALLKQHWQNWRMESPTQVPAVELRISISETDPLIWRQLVLPENATVAELHAAIQCAFDWKNAHLYAVAGHDQAGKKRIITRVAEDDDAPEGAEEASGVELRELFDSGQPGKSSLEYDYDFGDNWTHEIEVVGPALIQESTITCTGGEMRGPLEDSGGVYGYANIVRAIRDTTHPEHDDMVGWLEWVTSERADRFDPTAFDMEAVNGELHRLAQRLWPEAPTQEDMEAVLAPVSWLLSEANPDGLDLTSAGWLKPAIVKRMMTELNWDDDWFGPGRNEVNIPEVRNLREQLQNWKLLRKSKNKLLLTPLGRRVVQNPAALWEFLANHFASPDSPVEKVITQLLVSWELAGVTPGYATIDEAVRSELSMLGFRVSEGNGLIPLELAHELFYDVKRPLEFLSLWGPRMWRRPNAKLSDVGTKFLLDVQRRLGDG